MVVCVGVSAQTGDRSSHPKHTGMVSSRILHSIRWIITPSRLMCAPNIITEHAYNIQVVQYSDITV